MEADRRQPVLPVDRRDPGSVRDFAITSEPMQATRPETTAIFFYFSHPRSAAMERAVDRRAEGPPQAEEAGPSRRPRPRTSPGARRSAARATRRPRSPRGGPAPAGPPRQPPRSQARSRSTSGCYTT